MRGKNKNENTKNHKRGRMKLDKRIRKVKLRMYLLKKYKNSKIIPTKEERRGFINGFNATYNYFRDGIRKGIEFKLATKENKNKEEMNKWKINLLKF